MRDQRARIAPRDAHKRRLAGEDIDPAALQAAVDSREARRASLARDLAAADELIAETERQLPEWVAQAKRAPCAALLTRSGSTPRLSIARGHRCGRRAGGS
jgi:hypothetical protein